MLGAAIPSLQASLSSIATLAAATNGDPATFERVAGPIVAAQQPFDSVALWQIGPGRRLPARAARRQGLRARDAAAGPGRGGLRRARARRRQARRTRRRSRSSTCSTAARRRLGYAYAGPDPAARYVVYGERDAGPQPEGQGRPRTRRSRTSTTRSSSATKPGPAQLIASSTGGARLAGRTGSTTVAVRRHEAAARRLAAEGARRLAAGLAAVDPRRVRPAVHRRGRAHGVAALEAAQRGRAARVRERAALRRPAQRRPDAAAQPAPADAARGARARVRRDLRARAPRASTSAATGTRS